MNKLFVYGIFLDEHNRKAYGMTNPTYDTVRDFVTFGNRIVMAEHIPNSNTALTGLVVDMNPHYWKALDQLEGAYERVVITTTYGNRAYMYAKKGTGMSYGRQKATSNTQER